MGIVQSQTDQTQFPLQFHVLPTITDDLPTQRLVTYQLNIPHEIQSSLADPEFNKPGSVDMLLGAEIFFDIIRRGKHVVSEHAAFQETAFGWILVGKILTPTSLVTVVRTVVNQCSVLSLFSFTIFAQLCKEEEAVKHKPLIEMTEDSLWFDFR